ncbi:MAG: phosphatidylserine decarboxylase [Planctomycetota bacterium]|nr:MAG: phosphatidylserine decarboxylase [Planctomycetota bacterium]
MPTGKLNARIEQVRQASSIHGGLFNMWLMKMGVKLSRVPIPSQRLRLKLYRTIYGKKYPALVEDDLEHPLESYRSFNALFTRGIRPELRPLPEEADHFVSPCDGTVQDVGVVDQQAELTVKGTKYSVGSLLADTDETPFRGGRYAIFFLSPADCHRVFAPQDGMLEEICHVPGRRLLVHPPYQREEYPVFTLNERVVMRFSTNFGPMAVVMVAGWGVGNITHPFSTGLKRRSRLVQRRRFKDPRPVERGEWIGTFELGSTVILLTSPHEALMPLIAAEDKVQYGGGVFANGVSMTNGHRDEDPR